MKQQLVGRAEEKSLLREVLASSKSELVSVIGRRRVGKAFLVGNVFEEPRKQILWVFLSTFGFVQNAYSSALFARSLDLEDLFVLTVTISL